jgi:Ca2+-binding EF-hand superfamily protein
MLSRRELAAFIRRLDLPVPADQLSVNVMSMLFGSADNVNLAAVLAAYTNLEGDPINDASVIEWLDTDGDEEVSLTEFETFLDIAKTVLFYAADQDDNGQVSWTELDQILDIVLSEGIKTLVFNEADKDGSGRLNGAEWEAAFNSAPSPSREAAFNSAPSPSLQLFVLLSIIFCLLSCMLL